MPRCSLLIAKPNFSLLCHLSTRTRRVACAFRSKDRHELQTSAPALPLRGLVAVPSSSRMRAGFFVTCTLEHPRPLSFDCCRRVVDERSGFTWPPHNPVDTSSICLDERNVQFTTQLYSSINTRNTAAMFCFPHGSRASQRAYHILLCEQRTRATHFVLLKCVNVLP